jgi:hypothetical protein
MTDYLQQGLVSKTRETMYHAGSAQTHQLDGRLMMQCMQWSVIRDGLQQ